MISKIFNLFRSSPRDFRVIAAQEHGLSPNDISLETRKVIKALHEAGYQAFVVGGAVRDMLLGSSIKDFDVATNAEPQAIKRLFRRAYIIGRRFRIVHVHQGREVVEVTTFRGSSVAHHHVDPHGRILNDNAFGTHWEDAHRRDFTINALYYDPRDNTVWDAHQGYQDLAEQRLRTIGKSSVRFREDPVRMLRMLRFSAKLGFQIDPSTRQCLKKMLPLLEMIPSARLADEFSKYLLGGYAQSGLHTLRDWNILPRFIDIGDHTPKKRNDYQATLPKMILLVLAEADRRYAEQQSISFGFMMAAMLWSKALIHFEHFCSQKLPAFPAFQEAIRKTLNDQTKKTILTKSLSTEIRELWTLQQMLLYPRVQKIDRLRHHRRLKVALDLLNIRAQTDDTVKPITQQLHLPSKRTFLKESAAECAYWFGWWRHYLSAGETKRESMVEKWRHTLENQRHSKKQRNKVMALD